MIKEIKKSYVIGLATGFLIGFIGHMINNNSAWWGLVVGILLGSYGLCRGWFG